MQPPVYHRFSKNEIPSKECHQDAPITSPILLQHQRQGQPRILIQMFPPQFPHRPKLDNSVSNECAQLLPMLNEIATPPSQTNVCVTHYKSKPSRIITSSPPHHHDHDVPSTQSVESSSHPLSPSSLPSVEQHIPPLPPPGQ